MKKHQKKKTNRGEKPFMETLARKMKAMMCVEEIDKETARMIERLVVLRISTKHINLWIRQLEMKRRKIYKLTVLMKFEEMKDEIKRRTSKDRREDVPTSSQRR